MPAFAVVVGGVAVLTIHGVLFMAMLLADVSVGAAVLTIHGVLWMETSSLFVAVFVVTLLCTVPYELLLSTFVAVVLLFEPYVAVVPVVAAVPP
jgi:hypothetical protein